MSSKSSRDKLLQRKGRKRKCLPSKYLLTMQISNEFIDTCYNLQYGGRYEMLDTIFSNIVIDRDHEKVSVQIEDESNIILSDSSSDFSHSFVDMGYRNDSWIHDAYILQTHSPEKNSPTSPLEAESKLKVLNQIDYTLETNYDEETDVECDESFERNSVENGSVDFNFGNPSEVKEEVLTFADDSYSSTHELRDCEASAGNNLSSNSVRKPSRKSSRKQTPVRRIPRKNSSAHTSEVNLGKDKDEEKLMLDLSSLCDNVRQNVEASNSIDNDTDVSDSGNFDDGLGDEEYKPDKALLDRQLKTNADNKTCDTVSASESESEENESWIDPNREKTLDTYVVRVQCPECEDWCRYHRSGIMKHIRESHPHQKKELTKQLRQDITVSTSCKENEKTRKCEFCKQNIPENYLTLHLQWQHVDGKYERTQALFEKLYQNQHEIANKTQSHGFQLSFVKENTVRLVFCKKCREHVSEFKMSTHHLKCKTVKRKVLRCPCGFKTLIQAKLDSHNVDCNFQNDTANSELMNVFMVRTECPVCKTWKPWNRNGIIRHLRLDHKDMENVEELLEQYRVPEETPGGDSEKLECEMCGEQYSENHLLLHISERHLEKKYEKCQRIFQEIFSRRQSAGESTEFESPVHGLKLNFVKVCSKETEACKFCGVRLILNKMATHLKKCRLNPSKDQSFNCSRCKFRTADREEFEAHKSDCRQNPQSDVVCEYCGKSNRSRSEYYKHRKFVHKVLTSRTTAIKEFSCEFCPTVFNLKCRLRKHIIDKHSDARNYVCEICASAFKHSNALKRHIDFAHHNIYLYHCDKCGHGVNKRKQLETHVCGKTRNKRKRHEIYMSQLEDKLDNNLQQTPENQPSANTHTREPKLSQHTTPSPEVLTESMNTVTKDRTLSPWQHGVTDDRTPSPQQRGQRYDLGPGEAEGDTSNEPPRFPDDPPRFPVYSHSNTTGGATFTDHSSRLRELHMPLLAGAGGSFFHHLEPPHHHHLQQQQPPQALVRHQPPHNYVEGMPSTSQNAAETYYALQNHTLVNNHSHQGSY